MLTQTFLASVGRHGVIFSATQQEELQRDGPVMYERNYQLRRIFPVPNEIVVRAIFCVGGLFVRTNEMNWTDPFVCVGSGKMRTRT